MTTILDLARHAGLSPEAVLRVVLREPMNEEARQRVAAAIAELGPPEYPLPDLDVDVLPGDPNGGRVAPAETEGFRVEVHTLAEELRALFRDLVGGAERKRRERIEDVALVTELVIEGWRNVDRRLGRLEKIVDRLGETVERTQPAPRVVSMDEPREASDAAQTLRERLSDYGVPPSA